MKYLIVATAAINSVSALWAADITSQTIGLDCSKNHFICDQQMECCGIATKDKTKETISNVNYATDQIVICNRKDNPVYRFAIPTKDATGKITGVKEYDYTF